MPRKIEGLTHEGGVPILNGRIICPAVGDMISAVHCQEFCCRHFEAKQQKRGKLEVWCNYEEECDR